MTKLPSGLVPEDTEVMFTCLTDEANPTASVIWTVDGDSRSVSTALTEDVNTYNALRRKSVLILTANKTLHNRKVKCLVFGSTGITAEETLDVAYVSLPLTVILSPSTSNPAQAGTSVTFTCALDANPAPSYSIWTNGGPSQKWVDLDTNTNSVTLTIKKQQNKINLFCRADGSLTDYPVNSAYKSYTVQFSASTITMTKYPPDSVTENTEVTFTCVTDESEPTADVVWSVDGNTRNSDSDSTEEGMYNTQKRISVLTVRVDRTLHNKEVECHVSGKSAVRETAMVDVMFPQNIEVIQSPSKSVSEGSSVILICEGTGGNPPEVLSYSWSFEPRYEVGSPLSSSTNKELEFENVQYTQAGMYRCDADNGAGVGTGEKEVFVQFSPVDITALVQKTTFAEVNSKTTISCTVRAYPPVTSDHVKVMFRQLMLPADTFSVQSIANNVDETLIELAFDLVTAEDFGLYEFFVQNGVGYEVAVIRKLEEVDVPQSPYPMMIGSITAISVSLSWISAENGGFDQTFTVSYKEENDSVWQTIPGIDDPGIGMMIVYTVQNLKPETVYAFHVTARNILGSSPEQLVNFNKTLDLPSVIGKPEAVISSNNATFIWNSLQGTYTKVEIQMCKTDCAVIYEIRSPSAASLSLGGTYSSNTQFKMAFYQGNYLVNDIFFIARYASTRDVINIDSDKGYTGLIIGIVLTAVIAGLFIMFVIICVILYKNGKLNRCLAKPSEDNENGNVAPPYENVKPKTDPVQYEMTQRVEPSTPAEYTDLKQISYEAVG